MVARKSIAVLGFLLSMSFPMQAADTLNGKHVSAAKTFRASQLMGLNVNNSAGEKLGTVEDIVINLEDGKVAYVALSFGGVLGIGDKLFAVPYRQMKFMHGKDEMHFVLDVSKDKLKTAPGFDKNHWPDFADPHWIQQIDQFYGDETTRSARANRR